MIDQKTLGRRIRYFRKRACVSQLELEMEIGASAGMLSRIESGKVNPSKETILKIASTLQLKPLEINFFLGIYDVDVTASDIGYAKDSFKSFLEDERVYAYMLDNRSRIMALSSGFYKLAQLNNFRIDKLIGHHVAEVLFDPNIGRGLFDSNKFEETAIPVVGVLILERGFLLGEDWWDGLLRRLRKLPDFNRIWDKVLKMDIDLMGKPAKTVYFSLDNKSTKMIYQITTLHSDPRFSLLEYQEDDRF